MKRMNLFEAAAKNGYGIKIEGDVATLVELATGEGIIVAERGEDRRWIPTEPDAFELKVPRLFSAMMNRDERPAKTDKADKDNKKGAKSYNK